MIEYRFEYLEMEIVKTGIEKLIKEKYFPYAKIDIKFHKVCMIRKQINGTTSTILFNTIEKYGGKTEVLNPPVFKVSFNVMMASDSLKKDLEHEFKGYIFPINKLDNDVIETMLSILNASSA